jgi:hypothetical protein
MADKDNGANSWPGFLSEMSKGFLILRDVFGYALPGAVFLGVGLICRRFSLSDLQFYVFNPYTPPAWLAAVLGLGACYVVGHVMAAIACFPYNFGPGGTAKEEKRQKDVEANKRLILVRGQHPELLIELDRQGTMTMMRGASSVALLVGSICFWWLPKTPSLGFMLCASGALLLLVFYWSAKPHIGRLTEATNQAADALKSTPSAPASVPALKQVLQDAICALAEALRKL